MLTDSVFILIQEGGSSQELYVHGWDTLEEAEQDRLDCSRDGGYSTSKVLEVPRSLADHPNFYDFAEDLLRLTFDLECVEVPDADEVPEC